MIEKLSEGELSSVKSAVDLAFLGQDYAPISPDLKHEMILSGSQRFKEVFDKNAGCDVLIIEGFFITKLRDGTVVPDHRLIVDWDTEPSTHEIELDSGDYISEDSDAEETSIITDKIIRALAAATEIL